MSVKKKEQQQEQEQEQEQEHICPVCLKNERTKGLMCSDCYGIHKEEVVKRIKDHNHQPARSQLEFVFDGTEQNLNNLTEELGEKMEETRTFFGQAHQEVSRELSRTGVRLEKKEFLECVKGRYREMLINAGSKALYERVEWLKKTVYFLEGQMNWFERLRVNQSGSKSEKEIKEKAAGDVPETAAVA
ncbi:MAG: hypothetical protein A2V72_00120 [Candidatus Nealsonbacteria bacterium RBG_13_37_56]|uniref:Uncharacterized protein n=1 Tax=Candidatus Nealsonbacteria bacterium RBG_13_37_56 TaxID=1801661 RepID=A0A1G2DVL7_9BACT|nr:MAG: hypothetical protein A2V72_00120 [Candidatus Nealsonbacteria bacterium RBG_13_37_56]